MGFVKGQSGNPAGRPKGKKLKTTEIREAFYRAFREDGMEGLREFKQKDPSTFYRIVASLLPKEVDANVTGTLNIHLVNYSDDDSAWQEET